MKRNRKGSKRRQQTIQVWTHDQARRVLPYVASIMRSLRDHRLEAQRQHLTATRLAGQNGRPNRDSLIAHEEALRGARLAEDQFQEVLEELHTLDVFCLDPVRGLALIPFAHGEQLAWFVFDLFEPQTLRFWRYHQDPIETRRPIADVLAGPAGDNSLVI